MPNLAAAFALIHISNIIGVIGTYLLSKFFLAELICSAAWLKPMMAKFDDQVNKYGIENAIFVMISLRLIPGSPNYTYNCILPHV